MLNNRLAKYPGLRLHDLNYNDIEELARHKLKPFPTIAITPSQVATRAEGVFLWAAVTLQSIIVDLNDGMSAGDAAEIFNEMLRELEEMFADMLD